MAAREVKAGQNFRNETDAARLPMRHSNNRAMSAFGTKRTCRVALHMSAFGGKADMTIALRNVR